MKKKEVSERFQFKNKKIIVTGSNRGLGQEIALDFAKEGASLVLADIICPEETAKLARQLGSPCLALEIDVSDDDSVKRMVEEALCKFGDIDILVNNAGVGQSGSAPTEDCPMEEWDRIIKINLRGTFLCSKSVGKQMIKKGGGSIINIASTAGLNGIPRAAAYCASKAGVIVLTKSLAVEWAKHNVRVNAVAPHYLETELTRDVRASEKILHGIIRQIPMGRFGMPREILGAVSLLASSASSYITGTVIVVDGGFLAS
jgi:NAD(P)-dependent dehydrogenase (short-subunit alcohol dehydrogenase family)